MGRSRDLLEPEKLLAEAGWVRRLAERLVRDPSGAEDVVQETWLAALEHPPEERGERGLRPWLARVVRNQAARRRRRETARVAVERRAARPESVPGGQEAVDRVASVQLVSAALLALAEPYRSAVALRHLEGQPAREIARRQGCGVEAARQRVSRGLALLRAELDRRAGGDRSAWSLMLATAWGLAREPGAASLAVTSTGVAGGALLGAKTIAVGVGLGLTVGAFVLWQRAPAAGDVRAALEPPAVSSEPDVEPVASEFALASPALESPRPDAQRVAAPAALAPAAPSPASLAGSVLDERGVPVPGASLELVVDDGSDAGLVVARATSAESGRFEVSELEAAGAPTAGTELTLRASASGYVPCEHVVAAVGSQDLQLVLLRRPVVVGRLLAPDGSAAAPPGEVELLVVDALGERHASSVAVDSQGSFRSGDLIPGRLITISGRAKGFAPGERSLELDLEPGSQHDVELVLAPGVRVEGVVLDDATSLPVPFAEVWSEAWRYDEENSLPTARADADGRYVLRGVVSRPPSPNLGDTLAFVQVSARAEGYVDEAFHYEIAGRRGEGVYGLDLRIRAATATLVGRVVWPDGQAAGGVLVYAVDAFRNFTYAQTDGEGRFGLEGLPAGRLELMAWNGLRAPAGAHACGRLGTELGAAGRELVEIVLQRGAGAAIGGRVLGPEGTPRAGARVRLAMRFQAEGFAMGMSSLSTETDAEGRFVFAEPPPGDYRVDVVDDALVPALDDLAVVLDAGQVVDDLEFELAAPIALAGWVDPGTHDPASLELELRAAVDGSHLARGEVATDGAFRFDGLYPRAYELVLRSGQRELARLLTPAEGSDRLGVVAGP